MCMCAQSCLTLWDPVYCNPPDPVYVYGILSKQEYWSRLPCPPPGDLPDPGIESEYPVSPALAGGFFTTEPPGYPFVYLYVYVNVYLT